MNILKALEQSWTTQQVAERLHATPDAVKKWMASGALARTTASGKTLIVEADLQAFLQKSTAKSVKTAA